MPTLTELLHLPLSSFANNVCAAQLAILTFKAALEIAIRWRPRWSKVWLQLSLASSVLFWGLYDDTHWSWRLNTLLPAAVATRLFYKGYILKDPEDLEVQVFSLSSSPSTLLFGPTQLCWILLYLGTQSFRTEEAALITASLWADTLAPIVGQSFGRHHYHMPLAGAKTMEGSLCVFLGTAVASYALLWSLGIPLLPLRVILVYAAIVAVVEGTAPGDMDNVAIAVALHVSLERVPAWLPA